MPIREHALFRRLDTPAGDAAKGSCYIYHTTGACVDTGVLIDFEGNLTIGLTALREMAEVAGFSFEEEGVALEQRNAFLERELAEAKEQLAEANSQLEAVGVAIARAAAAKQ